MGSLEVSAPARSRGGSTSAFDCQTFDVADFVARGVVISGTGDLAGLRGSIKFDETTYEGVLR